MDKYKYYMDFDIKKKYRLDLFLLYTNKNILNNKIRRKNLLFVMNIQSALKKNDICLLSCTKKRLSVIEKSVFSILIRLLFDFITTVDDLDNPKTKGFIILS